MKNELNVSLLSKTSNVLIARNILLAFLSDVDIELSIINELKTSLSEAVTNAIVHGYLEDESKKVVINLIIDDEFINIEVIDEGVGIKDIELAREPLFTTKKDSERAGLGFTIMEVFSDSLKIESYEGIGTKVIMQKKYK